MGLGYFVIVILAGLQTVPRDLYDAAAVDGAGPSRAGVTSRSRACDPSSSSSS
ncbi:MAG: hypothetical protein R3C32_00500 [Chloroflexota bacterium]